MTFESRQSDIEFGMVHKSIPKGLKGWIIRCLNRTRLRLRYWEKQPLSACVSENRKSLTIASEISTKFQAKRFFCTSKGVKLSFSKLIRGKGVIHLAWAREKDSYRIRSQA